MASVPSLTSSKRQCARAGVGGLRRVPRRGPRLRPAHAHAGAAPEAGVGAHCPAVTLDDDGGSWTRKETGRRRGRGRFSAPCERTRVVQPRLGADGGVRRAGGTRATALGGAHVGPAGRGPAWGARGCWVNPEPRQGRRRLVDVRRSVHHLRRGGGNSAVHGDAGGAAGPRARRGEPDPGADAALPSVWAPRGRVRGAGREGGRRAAGRGTGEAEGGHTATRRKRAVRKGARPRPATPLNARRKLASGWQSRVFSGGRRVAVTCPQREEDKPLWRGMS